MANNKHEIIEGFLTVLEEEYLESIQEILNDKKLTPRQKLEEIKLLIPENLGQTSEIKKH